MHQPNSRFIAVNTAGSTWHQLGTYIHQIQFFSAERESDINANEESLCDPTNYRNGTGTEQSPSIGNTYNITKLAYNQLRKQLKT